jgi:tryptophan-rich sensory protein
MNPEDHKASDLACAPGVARSILMLFAFLGVVFGCAAAAGYITAQSVTTWYVDIIKPENTPEAWVFPIVWNFLFFLMGLSGWLVWRKAGGLEAAGAAMSIFVLQLMLNFTWTLVFFGLHALGLAVVTNLALDVAIGLTIYLFCRHSRIGALLLVPYFLWSLFATWLSFAIWRLNA